MLRHKYSPIIKKSTTTVSTNLIQVEPFRFVNLSKIFSVFTW